jgi:hypothetical protein
MTTRGRLLGWLLLGLLGGMLGQGCGSSSTPPAARRTGAAGTGGKDGMSMTVEPQGGLGGNGGLSPYDVLCGIVDEGCIPDQPTNDLCKPSVESGPSPIPGAGRSAGGGSGTAGRGSELVGGAGAGAAAGDGSEAGNGGAPAGGQSGESPDRAGAAGAPTDNGGNDSSGGESGGPPGPSVAGRGAQGGASGRAGGPPGTGGSSVSTLSLTSCQVSEDSKHAGRPKAACLPAGNGQDGEPCFSGADCRAGFACVGQGPGQCRQYCCSGAESCRARTHCSAEHLVLPGAKGMLEVPVCMPVVNCSLAEPPCEAGATCSCPADSACVLVGSDRTTSCVKTSTLPPEGEGEEGMPCPCAWGFVCSQATQACVKLCQVAAPELACDGARCQPSNALPDGWGTCVGVPPKGSR